MSEQVAGPVLLDPTPINDARSCVSIERLALVLGRLAVMPGIGRVVAAVFRSAALQTARGLRPDCAAAAERTAGLDIPKLARAVRGPTGLSCGFRESDLPRRPAVVVTAERNRATRSAWRTCGSPRPSGGEVRSWPGATHSVHLDHPDEVLETVRELVGRVAGAS